MTGTWTTEHGGAVRWAALGVPVVAAAVLGLARDSMSTSTAAMLLVLAVVAAAATGDRVAGVLAALAAAAGFDFFLTAPYHSLAIADRDDVEMAAALVLVGLAVTEVALWGRRQQAAALRRDGYLQGLAHLLDVPADAGTDERGRQIAAAITEVLGADRTEWVPENPRPNDVVVGPRGEVRLRGTALAVGRVGLPTDSWTALPVRRGDRVLGHFRVVASTHVVRPSREQLRVAMLLADRMAAPAPTTDGTARHSQRRAFS